ncbi:DPP IV N-terminal domain-containing protein [Planctomycetes bacterium CA13]
MKYLSFLIAVTLLCPFILIHNVQAKEGREFDTQSMSKATWQDEATRRLKGVYDRGDFRAAEFQSTWLRDSSAYTMRENDPQTGKPVRWRYDVLSGQRSKAEAAKDHSKRRSPNGKLQLESREGSLFVRNVQSDEQTPLLKAADGRDIVYRDLCWSPNGEFVSFVEIDRTDVAQRSVLVPKDPSYPGVAKHRFARVGGKIESLRVGIIDVQNQTNRWLSLDTPDEGFYLGQVDWVPKSNELLVETFSRFRDKREFLIAKPDGELTRIFREVNEAWAVGSHQINSGATWIRDGEAFILISEKDGWRHAWLCSRDGKQETLLTSGEFDIIDRAAVDENGGWYYFYASPENGTQKYLHRVPLDGSGTLERISPADQPGTHSYDFSPDTKWAIHTYSTLNIPPIVDLIELPEHKTIRVLNDHRELHARAKQTIKNPTEFVQIDIGDGVVMDASITKPSDFDEAKKYPLFVYVYGEPYLQTVLDRWGAAQIDFHRVVADMGYVVVSIDNRGTACPKGAAWRRSIFGSLGPLSTQEQAAAIEKLASMRPYVDLSRVGIWGWSGGGSNTLNAMFRKPDLYHVGIAVVPKPQPHLYNAWFQEIYMRTPEVNADGYQRSAPIHFAEGLKGKLLIVTGSGETNTHIQIIEGLVDRLIELGKPFDYMVYPNRDHGLREGPGSLVHVRMLILRHLIENLPRGPR